MRYFIFLIFILIISCRQEDAPTEIISPVNYNLEQMPYTNLSEYNFFEGNIANLKPVYGVLPYNLINKLFTDYAHKKRFIWMPKNVKANYISDYEPLDFPIGTILIKNFYYDNTIPDNRTKLVETRLMIKKEAHWVFATYQWNDEQTEATYNMSGANIPVDWINEANETKHVAYHIPPGADCLTCHQSNDNPKPIGPKPQNINWNYNYTDGENNQMDKWVEMGYLNDNYPDDMETVAKWDDYSQTLNDRVRAYLDINCAHCHSDNGYCNYRSMRFAFNKTENPDNLGICIVHQEPIGSAPFLTHIITPQVPNRSVLYYRLNTIDETIRMPLKGRTVIHQEAVNLIENWINSLTDDCN
ncbi:MAG TPA: hypothetical protein ENK67_08275 [Flavobacteriia bacterium]|nr:hypothetical protein [Flavobacteriia bacterium]